MEQDERRGVPNVKRRRVLLVMSSYSPFFPANMHRGRLLAWSLPDFGWDLEILVAPRELQQQAWLEPSPDRFCAPGVVIHQPGMVRRRWLDAIGVRGIGWRGLLPLWKSGVRLVRSGRFDVVLITTTAFNLFVLGRLWKRAAGVPYVLDFQDPWYRPRGSTGSTNHPAKEAVGNWISRALEAFALGGADGVMSVSPDYLGELTSRYPEAAAWREGRSAVIPFGGTRADWSAVDRASPILARRTAQFTVAYVGVGGNVMQKSFRHFARTVAALREKGRHLVDRFTFLFVGTEGGWREGDEMVLSREAAAVGIGDLVEEHPRIVSYSTALATARRADGLMVLGVNDKAYMPSKLFGYALSGKPVLCCLHDQSQARTYFDRFPELAHLLKFCEQATVRKSEEDALVAFLEAVASGVKVDREGVQAVHSGRAMTRSVVELLDDVVGRA